MVVNIDWSLGARTRSRRVLVAVGMRLRFLNARMHCWLNGEDKIVGMKGIDGLTQTAVQFSAVRAVRKASTVNRVTSVSCCLTFCFERK